jgi:hypothetical protein
MVFLDVLRRLTTSVQIALFLRVVSPFLPQWTILGMFLIESNWTQTPIFIGFDRVFPQLIALGTIPRVTPETVDFGCLCYQFVTNTDIEVW